MRWLLMKTSIDPDTCIGCGLCPSIASEVYEMGDDGKAHPISEDVPEGSHSEAQEAADSCPVSAISIDEP
jgi:ferredoxin